MYFHYLICMKSTVKNNFLKLYNFNQNYVVIHFTTLEENTAAIHNNVERV